MVCIHCGQKTQVTNSRPQHRTNQVWRRRACLSCKAIFSTLEAADYGAAWLVRSSGGLTPFNRDKLFLSLYHSCQHRPAAISDATALTDTVISKILAQAHDGVIGAPVIAATVAAALNRFDKPASVHYQAFHGNR
jgi:transcriptional repressor NrdR